MAPKHKRQFQEFYKHREELCVSPDGILSLNDRIVVPPSLRNSILQDLHSCHLGVHKMKSLARQTVWWPELNADISAFVSKCARCLFKKPSVKTSNWNTWPLTYMPWQKIHADYCGPFLKHCYALILIDSYSKWPEVFLTTKADGAFTKLAMCLSPW